MATNYLSRVQLEMKFLFRNFAEIVVYKYKNNQFCLDFRIQLENHFKDLNLPKI